MHNLGKRDFLDLDSRLAMKLVHLTIDPASSQHCPMVRCRGGGGRAEYRSSAARPAGYWIENLGSGAGAGDSTATHPNTLSAAGSELVWPMPSESAENRFKSDDDDWKNDNGSGFYRAAPELYAHDDGAASLNASVY